MQLRRAGVGTARCAAGAQDGRLLSSISTRSMQMVGTSEMIVLRSALAMLASVLDRMKLQL
jgi:hypothetical protein